MTVLYIIVAALVGGTLSALLAGLAAWRIQPRLIPVLVSFAVGTMLGLVFLDLLPHIFEQTTNYHASAGWILAGVLGFFLLEKLVLWRHDHGAADIDESTPEAAAAHAEGRAHEHVQLDVHRHTHVHTLPAQSSHDQHHSTHHHAHHHHGIQEGGKASSAWMVIVGDGFHNFTDGLAIAAAFTADFRLGVLTSIAVIAHEIPHELGNFVVLIHSGFSRTRAMMWNIISSLATLVGALLAYFLLQVVEAAAPVFLCLAAASMIYVAIADLIPTLHRRTRLSDSLTQFALIGLGIFTIWCVHLFVSH
jgi:zinc and cadmium transporter